jgi:Ca-activated chloride channel family protein
LKDEEREKIDPASAVSEVKQEAAAPVLPQVSIVQNPPVPTEVLKAADPNGKELSDRAEARAVAPVQTPAQIAELAKRGQPVITPAPAGALAPVMTQEELAALARGVPLVAPPATAAATATASLVGTVEDSAKALIPGVTITATSTGTGVTNTTITNESGAYSFPSLLPGTYNVSAVLPGFQTQRVTNLPVGDNQQARVNYTLQVAAQATTVQVSVDASQLITTSAASVGNVLNQERIADLPLVGNNVVDLITTMPGIQGAAAPPPPPPAQRQQAQGQGQGQGVGGGTFSGAGGGRGGGGGGGRGGAAAPRGGPASATTPSPAENTTVAGIRSENVTRDGLSTQEAQRRAREESGKALSVTVDGFSNSNLNKAAAPPPPPPAPPARPVVVDRPAPTPNTEAYDRVTDNPFIRTTQENLATFSIDVDTASYANVRRFLTQNQLPPADAVRIEELVNYFSYDYAQPTGNAPIAPNMEVAAAPWNPANRLVRIGVKAREVNANRRPSSNLVFLIDVSGSMSSPEKLPLVKAGLNMLVERLGENDSVSIVVYAGNSGLVLPPTSGMRKETIRQAIDNLQPGGSTNGASGIQLAYNQAIGNFQRGGVNRVILMTDGDFNVGITNQGDLTRLIEDRAKSGVFLSVLGFGMGNYKDSTLEKLADQGNGNYAYIDNLAEARKVLVEEMSGTLITVAKDVKIQVDFNPARVEAYRLIGYENRVLRTEDFNNDAKDAGDMGAGHTVTALFEVVPKGGQIPGPSVDPSKYTQPQGAGAARGGGAANGASSNEMLTLRVRYKLPDADNSTRMDVPLVDRGGAFERATTDFRFAASVAEFGMILRNSPYKGTARMDSVLDIAEGAVGPDRNGYRKEFITLVQRARNLIR